MIMNKYYILIAEGIADCSLLEAILEKYLGFTQYQNVKELPELFRDMIGTYPASTGALRRQDSPVFYYKDTVGIAVKQAGGCSKIPVKISALAELIDKLDLFNVFGGFLVFCDTDLNTREEIKADFVKKFRENEILFEHDRLKFSEKEISCKLHLFPSNGVGAIEKLLLECTNILNAGLYQDAMEYRNKIMGDDYQEIRKTCWAKKEEVQEFYADKVQFGSISAVLKPDKPVRFAIKDKLITSSCFNMYMELPEFKELHNFLQNNLAP